MCYYIGRNHRKGYKYLEQLYNYMLPEHTTIEEKHQLSDQLVGSGNDMDFLATIVSSIAVIFHDKVDVKLITKVVKIGKII